ncbi:MAG: hypothetical protein ACRCXM_07065 [Beijerinckiaceae bacterium]
MHSAAARVDPAADAAYLLRRLGLAVLCIALPMAAFSMRRAAVILMPVGVILLILAAMFDPAEKPFGAQLGQALRSPLAWLAIGFAAWAVLSLIWTPAVRAGTDRAANIAGVMAVAIGAMAALPHKLRAPTLYLLPIGAFAAAVIASVMVLDVRMGRFMFSGPEDAVTIQRGLATLMLLSVPALGWLVSRGRVFDAILLVIALLAVAFTGQDWVAGGGLLAALAAFGLTYGMRHGRMVVFLLLAALISVVVLAPLAAKGLQGQTLLGIQLMPLASESFLRKAMRVMSGYGLETAPRLQARGYFASSGPTYLAALWFDLGVVAIGIVVTALGLWARRAATLSAELGAASMALMAAAAVQAAAMPGTGQAWWISALVAAAVGLAAIERGHARTRRPGIGFFSRPSAGGPAQPAAQQKTPARPGLVRRKAR